MELQLQDLIASIRKDGVDAAEAEAAAIIDAAKKKAEEIVSAAKAEAQTERENAARDIEKLRLSAVTAAEQARRNACLGFKAEVQKSFEKLLAADVKAGLKDEALAKLIQAVLAEEDMAAYTAEVETVTDALKKELREAVEQGLVLKASPEAKGGFRLVANDGSGYIDCSAEELAAMLLPYFGELSL